jgi:hypothetical protein
MTDCVAAIYYANYSGLQSFDGSAWTGIDGTLTTPGEADIEWHSVSCTSSTSCLATSFLGYVVGVPPPSTQTAVNVDQVGPREVLISASVTWNQPTTDGPSPSLITYNDYGQPIPGCTDLSIPPSATSPEEAPACDVIFETSGPYSFSATVSDDAYFIGSSSPSVVGSITNGYWMVGSDGSVYPFGSAVSYGSMDGTPLAKPVVGMTTTAFDLGYWLVASDGGIFSFGDAQFYGSTGSIRLNKPIVGMSATPDGLGYWLVASDGGIFTFGDAQFYGSTGGIHLNQPIVGMATTPDGGGYWLVASDGGIFSFGDAQFYGSTGSIHLNQPIVGMTTTPDGGGYWLVASDGGIFSFGDAQFYGSTGSIHLNKPIVAMASSDDGGGYVEVASDGGIFAFGDEQFYGSTGNRSIPAPIVAIQPT